DGAVDDVAAADPYEVDPLLAPRRATAAAQSEHLAPRGDARARHPSRAKVNEPVEPVQADDLDEPAADPEHPDRRPAHRRAGRRDDERSAGAPPEPVPHT